MTLRQVLAIVKQHWLIVSVTAVLVLLTALAYARITPPAYSSTATFRFSQAATSAMAGGPDFGDVVLDLDPEYVTSPELLKRVATTIDDDPDALQGAVSTQVVEGFRTSRLEITATGGSPAQTQARANAVGTAYAAHLKAQVADGLDDLRADLTEQQAIQTKALTTLRKRPQDLLAQQHFNTSSSEISQLQASITQIERAGGPLTMVQAASPGSLTSTATSTILLIGLVSGLLAGAGAALLRHLFDDRLRTPEAIEEVTGGRALDEVATASRQLKRMNATPSAVSHPTAFNESIRALRTSLEVVLQDRRKMIAVTSAEPGEGKTFIVANLAVSMVRAGRTVIAVEGDLRRPRLQRYFGTLTADSGLAELIEAQRTAMRTVPDRKPARSSAEVLGQDAEIAGDVIKASEDIISAGADAAPAWDLAAALERCLVPTEYPGLRILCAGVSDDEPADLLAADAATMVLDHLSTQADLVLIDTPPALALADAVILGTRADGVIVVAAQGRTRRSALQQVLRALKANRVNLLGVVINRSRRAHVRSYGQYYDEAQPRRLQDEWVSAEQVESEVDAAQARVTDGLRPVESTPTPESASTELDAGPEPAADQADGTDLPEDVPAPEPADHYAAAGEAAPSSPGKSGTADDSASGRSRESGTAGQRVDSESSPRHNKAEELLRSRR